MNERKTTATDERRQDSNVRPSPSDVTSRDYDLLVSFLRERSGGMRHDEDTVVDLSAVKPPSLPNAPDERRAASARNAPSDCST